MVRVLLYYVLRWNSNRLPTAFWRCALHLISRQDLSTCVTGKGVRDIRIREQLSADGLSID